MNFLDNLLTKDEQKVLFFVLVLGIIGIVAFKLPLLAENNVQKIDSLLVKVKTPEKVQYDIKTITNEELCLIPGIGNKKALAIISYRDSVGFTSLTDLLNIKGIGVKRLDLIRGYFIPLKNDDEFLANKSFAKNSDKTQKIDINNANSEELCRIPRVGPKKAEAIILLRSQKKGFKNISELLEVKGIGQKTLDKIETYIVIGDYNG